MIQVLVVGSIPLQVYATSARTTLKSNDSIPISSNIANIAYTATIIATTSTQNCPSKKIFVISFLQFISRGRLDRALQMPWLLHFSTITHK